ncbi:MAG: adenylosuccinate synthase [Fervidobacterium sp.]|uniref:Adenylosuccinate synthetase n=1 Tax=Fervidobacterium gondwanense DSM 13020 TaxID=1121883 RepID=A0A1M7SRK5_FERGO|nr:adenylosuccinate synthase [Fervidobacterium gondwanense]UXF00609.1 adenylosuccinate synthetase [Fervidobacterium riparium]SHN61044.1 Adenylosuccinate synthetase [Fervidobacterium gondwanense DSM 13020]
MKSIVYGLHWGDEGKGKVTTYLSREYDYVVRYSGGSNAGHTVEYGNFKLVHHLVPSFDVRTDTIGYISNGVVVDLGVLNSEIEELKRLGFDVSRRIKVSNLAHVVLPVHKMLDEKFEMAKGDKAVGTTKRGIGPAYADKVHRIGLRLVDFENQENALEKLKFISELYKNLYSIDWTDYDKIFEEYEKIRSFVVSPIEIRKELQNSNVLFEGTQGVLLDIDMGSYPYVTGTYCNTTGVEPGLGYPMNIDKRIGVFKAYLTRVGEGPFPTELFGEDAEKLRKAGKEYGATTGRPRRCGWLDLPLLKYAIEISDCTEMIMTKADVLSGMDKVLVGVRYAIDGKKIDIPTDLEMLSKTDVEYVEFQGWKDLNDRNFAKFVEFLERETGRKITYISTGANVEDIVSFEDGKEN